jgi:soluble lytic murein transglycosylase
VESIPFTETRDYVRKVMSNTMYYARLFGQPLVTLKQRLGTVAPRPLAND